MEKGVPSKEKKWNVYLYTNMSNITYCSWKYSFKCVKLLLNVADVVNIYRSNSEKNEWTAWIIVAQQPLT